MRHAIVLCFALCFMSLISWGQVEKASSAGCLETMDAHLAQERAELQAILARHHSGQWVDGRLYGLPVNDFDDGTNLTVRQRLEFRRMNPSLDYPTSGRVQYPRWAFTFMNRLDRQGAVPCTGAPAQPQAQDGLGLSQPAALVIGPNINVSNDPTEPLSEQFLAIDPVNAAFMVGASNIDLSGRGQMMYFSADAGSTWSRVEIHPLRTNMSDPGVAFDSAGNVYTSTLDYTGNQTAVEVHKSTDHGQTWPTRIVVDDASGNDKELFAVDYQNASSCKDQIYVGWDNGHNQFVSSTTAPNSGVFAPKIVVQSKDFTIAGALAVGPPAAAGSPAPVYYVWTDTKTKTINFSKSTNCGATWTPFKAIATTKNSFDTGIPAQCVRRALIYPSIDADRSASARRGWIYVVWNDFTAVQSNGCVATTDPNNNNIWYTRSADGGATWSTPAMLNANIAFADHFNQWMGVDDATGTIHVSWRDTRNDPNRVKTDVYYTNSTDGLTFMPEVRITTAMSDEPTAGASPDQYGDYEGLAVRNGNAYPFWTDRRVQAPEQIFTSKITP